MKYKLKVYSIWEIGKRKDSNGNPHQEDCTYPLPDELKDSDRTFILCDGMGGHDAGEIASATVCQAMGNYIINDGHDTEGVFTDDDLKNAITVAFEELDKKDSGAEKKMGTTMTFLKLHNDGATIAHMGDSRVYHIRPGKDGAETQILFETEDHSLVNDLIKVGELTREEARRSRQKNVITRAMQPNVEYKPKADIKHITDIKAGDYFYMCSDGMLEDADMENGKSIRNIFSKIIESPERKVEILTDVTEDNRDNHTALIIHIEEVIGNTTEQTSKKVFSDVQLKRMGIVEEDKISDTSDSQQESTLTPELNEDLKKQINDDKYVIDSPANDSIMESPVGDNSLDSVTDDKPIESPAEENPIEEVNDNDESANSQDIVKKKQKSELITGQYSPRNTQPKNPKLILRALILTLFIALLIIVIMYL